MYSFYMNLYESCVFKFFENYALAVMEVLLRCSNALTCQSQLKHIGQEVQFLALFKPKHMFPWLPE